jgi:hypothetical protein
VTASFSFEHVFRAPSPAALLAIYFDPDNVAAIDAATRVDLREVLEVEDTPQTRRRVCKVTPKRQIPAFMRPFFPGRLHYVEAAIWHKTEDRLELDIRPSALCGRAHVVATYALRLDEPGLVRRTYAGSVAVDVALVGGRIEHRIVADLAHTLAISARCTQDYLDHQQAPDRRGVAAGT